MKKESDYWLSLPIEERLRIMTECRDKLQQRVSDLRQDCITMALRLYGEDSNTFAPETIKVMNKYKEEVEHILNNP